MAEDLRKKAAGLLALGSWHVYSRQTLDESVAFVDAALARGINRFDLADYWDCGLRNTTRFKEVMRQLGRPRGDYKIDIKVFTNSERTREQEVCELLGLLGIDYADSVLCSRPAPEESLEDACKAMDALVSKGLAKELDFSLWDAPLLSQAYDHMRREGLALPRYVQFQYNICRRDVVESNAYQKLFADTGLKLQAAFPLEGGILAGHTTRQRFDPETRSEEWFGPGDRNIARDSGGIRDRIVAKVPRLIEVAGEHGLTSAQLAIAFVTTNPNLESILFGATKIWQIDEAIDGVCYALQHPETVKIISEEFRVNGSAAPKLFDISKVK